MDFINVHCHLLNFDFVPDSFFKTRAPVHEWLLRHRLTAFISRIFTALCPGKKHDKFHELLDILRDDILSVADALKKEMQEANIVLSTPLMMDLETGSSGKKAEIPYRHQVKIISDIGAANPWVIMPFVMFDPLRKAASDLVIEALESFGFLGVKMYPALGCHPDPFSLFNEGEVNKELIKVYDHCHANSIPITTHCSKGGAYSSDVVGSKKMAQLLSQPSNWEGVLRKYPKLYLNFAHFGGKEGEKAEHLNVNFQQSWCNVIQRLMLEYENVYTDTSYHDDALEKKTSGRYFDTLAMLMNKKVVGKRIIFGTDWLMTRHTWKDRAFTKAFTQGFEKLESAKLSQIAMENPLNFLFPGRKLPLRIMNFYKSKNIDTSLPEWIKKNFEI